MIDIEIKFSEKIHVYEFPKIEGYAYIHSHHVTGTLGTAVGVTLENALWKYYTGKREVNFDPDINKLNIIL